MTDGGSSGASRQAEYTSTAFLQRYALILKATGVAGLIGLLMMALGSLLGRYSSIWSETVIEAGKVVVVTSVVGLIFEFLMHDRFVARVKQQVVSVEEQVKRLDTSIDQLQKTVAITSGAIESGLSAVYSDRQQAIDEIAALLSRAKEGDELSLLGISLGDFLCPHGRLYRRLAEALHAGANVRALLLDMNSDAARTRAQREEGAPGTPTFESPDWAEWYHSTRCYDELKTASDVARSYAPKFTGAPTGEGEGRTGTFECRTYTLSPLCFLAVWGDTMFLESYHYAGRGGEAPILKISKATGRSAGSSRLFEIYASHFAILWDVTASPISGPPAPPTGEPGPAT
jgi:hypothetical protein